VMAATTNAQGVPTAFAALSANFRNTSLILETSGRRAYRNDTWINDLLNGRNVIRRKIIIAISNEGPSVILRESASGELIQGLARPTLSIALWPTHHNEAIESVMIIKAIHPDGYT
jgi:hypothetical protein